METKRRTVVKYTKLTKKTPLSVHDSGVDFLVGEGEVETEATIQPRLEGQGTGLFVERKPRDVYGTRRRESARGKPEACPVSDHEHIGRNSLIKLSLDVFVVATSNKQVM